VLRVTTILVAEDDEGVRNLIETALRRHGHTVLSASDGASAMAILEREGTEVDLLVSDVNMPGIGGLELLALARARRPDLAAILASGTDRWELPPDRIDSDVTLLEKPFSIHHLIDAIDAALRVGQASAHVEPATKTDMGAEGDDGQVFGG
jgi:DNA-binding NtrC family response regulator